MLLNSPSDTPIENKTPIFTLEGFIQRQNEIQKQAEAGVFKGGRHMKFLEDLLDFQKVLISFYEKPIDPIAYIHTLYYIENQSFKTITSTIKGIYEKTNQEQKLFLTSSAIQRFGKERLHWKLKSLSESKNTFVCKNTPQKENIAEINQKVQEEKKINFLSWYIQSSNITIPGDYQENLQNYQYEYEKFIYILKNIFGISIDNFKKLKNYNLGTPFLAKSFNALLKENNIPFQIGEQTIRKTFLKYN